jgi:hypothetical protein
VCGAHGGRAPQSRLKARERLDEMVEPALVELRKLVARADSDGVRLSAIKDILDRTGYKLPERLETDNAVTIRVEYEVIETQPIQEPIQEPITIALEQTNGSYTNGATQKHSD